MPVALAQFCQKCLRLCQKIPWEAKLPLVEDHCVDLKETNEKTTKSYSQCLNKGDKIESQKIYPTNPKKADKKEKENKELIGQIE